MSRGSVKLGPKQGGAHNDHSHLRDGQAPTAARTRQVTQLIGEEDLG